MYSSSFKFTLAQNFDLSFLETVLLRVLARYIRDFRMFSVSSSRKIILLQEALQLLMFLQEQ
jgi:hypothetical protein